MEDVAKHCQKIFEILVQERLPVEPMIDDIIKFVNHSRRLIKDKDRPKGNKTGSEVYDGTALTAAKLASDGIHGYLCSQSIHWFDFELPGRLNFSRTSGMRAWNEKRLDEYPEVKVWLDECEEVQYAAFRRSNYYDFSPNFIREGMTLGTATAIIEEDPATGKIYFTLPHFRECFVAENQFGQCDTLYRPIKQTMKKLVQKFGEKFLDLKPELRNNYENNPYFEKDILQAIYPRTDYDPSKVDKKNRRFASNWILQDGNILIEESGYYDQPHVTWRWAKNADEVYGRSPAWDAFVEIYLANQKARTNLIAGHKMVQPPMAVPSDLKGKFQNVPGGETYIDGFSTQFKVPVPIQQGIQLPYGIDQQERSDKAIKEHFHVDFFLMLYQAAFNKVDLTATQVIGMQSEQAAVLGTRIGHLQSEALNPIMDRVFNIEVRAKRMPSPPPILQDMGGMPIEIDYLGPLSQAQKRLFNMQGIRAGIELAAQIAQVFPSSIDVIDGDKTMTEGLDAVGFPSKTRRTEDEILQIRLAKQQAMEAQQQAELMESMSKSTKNLSKPIEGGSPMEAMADGS